MANIYLRTSKYVAAFLRGDGNGESIPPLTPITLSPYTQEYMVLTNGLRIIPSEHQHWGSCYSQIAWSNMLRGIPPQGGQKLLLRNPSEYLSYTEICTLESLNNRTKTEAYDFLCIALPREITIDGRVIRLNKAYTLTNPAANQLRRMFRVMFIRAFLDFETENIDFAKSHNIHRSNVEIMERFLMKYDIPVSHDKSERDTLRRLAQRWRNEAADFGNRPSIRRDDIITRIDEHELRGGLPRYIDYDD